MTRAADLSSVADDVWRLSRVFDRMRCQVVADTEQVTDYTSMVLLTALVCSGPLRSGALAEHVHSDASTISRQVAALVGRGLVVRQADPGDGRATLLAATPAAQALVEDKRQHRDEQYARVLAGWSAADVRALAPLLGRLAADLERHLHAVTCGPLPEA